MKGTTLSMLKSTVSALGAEAKGRTKITYFAVLIGLAAAFFAALSGSQSSSATNFDNTLQAFSVAGQNVLNQNGAVLELTSTDNGGVQVVATPNDAGATVTSIRYDAGDDWTPADNGYVFLNPEGYVGTHSTVVNNEIKVTVEAANGSQANFTAEVHITPNANALLSEFTVSTPDIVGGVTDALPQNSIVTEPAGTTSVDVSAVPQNAGLGAYVVYGYNAPLGTSKSGKFSVPVSAGANNLVVEVHASNGSTTKVYTTTIQVEDLSLSTLTVDGGAVVDGDQYTLPDGNTAVTVVATATDANLGATVDVSGDSGVAVGNSDLTVTVNGWDGSTKNYVVHLTRKQIDTSLSTFSVEGQDGVENGDTVYLDHTFDGATPVLDILTTDGNASVGTVTAPATYSYGDNTVTFDVTAEDSTVVETYTVDVYVQNGNADLDWAEINGNSLSDGQGGFVSTYELSSHADSINVTGQGLGYNSEFTVSGDTNLVLGDNTLTLTVTAEDGTTQDYVVTVYNPNNDTSFEGFTINGDSYEPGSTVNLPFGTTDVTVDYTLADANAAAVVAGDSGLILGDNALTADVTAEDGTTQHYEWNLRVQNNDASLDVLDVNGNASFDGDSIVVPFTDHVDVVATANDANATVDVQGANGLDLGDNLVTVTITSEDGSEQTQAVVNVYVQNNDTSLSTFTINGQDAEDGASLVLPGGGDSAAVDAVPTDFNAVASVDGDTGLTISGTSTITVTVTAEDGTVATYTVSVYVQSANGNLAQFTVNGNPAEDGQWFFVDAGTPGVSVVATAADVHSTVVVDGASGLAAGPNSVTVSVTAEDGSVTDHIVYVKVAPTVISSQTGLSQFTVNGNQVEDNSVVNLPADTTGVSVVAVPWDGLASVNIDGASGLSAGDNALTVTVTAADGTVEDHVVTLRVAPHVVSSETGLSQFTVNGDQVEDGSIYNLDAGTTGVAVVAVPWDGLASVTIDGASGLSAGDNTLTVEVTAADGTVEDHTVTLRVAANIVSSETGLGQFTVNGTDVADGDTVELAAGTTGVGVAAVAWDNLASVVIAGNSGLKVGNNTLTVTVTAADGTVDVNTVTLHVAAAPKVNKINVALQLKNFKAGSAKLTSAQKAKVRDWAQTAQGFSAGNLVGYVKKGASNAEFVLAYKRAAALQAYISGIAGPGAKYSIHVYTTSSNVQAGFRLTGTY